VQADDDGVGAGGVIGDGYVELQLDAGDGVIGEIDVERRLRLEAKQE
jgi:hypothetical protein